MAQLQKAYRDLAASMAAARANADKHDRVDVMKRQMSQLAEIRSMTNATALASGQWHMQTVQTLSASQKLTEQLQKQKVNASQLKGIWSDYRNNANSALREAIREQTALRNVMASQMTANPFGKNSTDVFVPKSLGKDLDSARVKYGYITQLISSAATQTVNWGKNTQWAGRQITVGLTMPVGMAAAGAAQLAYTADKQLTRVMKVYDTSAKTMAGQEQELAQLRVDSLKMATDMANEYGSSLENTLEIQAQLAATGLKGQDLMQSTREAVRIATLGELDPQMAIDMTVSLQTAFRDTIRTTDDLRKAFDLMNAVENATSLGIGDIAEAVPRAASALAQLGGTVEEMTVMMVAMKEAGINPAEGANALKSATTRLLNPSKKAIEYFKETFKVDLPSIVKQADGNIFELMKTLAGLTSEFGNLEVQKGIGQLFGTYQFNRVNALWQNLGDAVNGVQNQTYSAMQTVSKSSEEIAGIADKETERWKNSIQGRFKRAVEGIKAELVPIGEVVLKVLTPVINAVTEFFKSFNSLDESTKKIILFGLGAAAIAGPFMMLIGIMANLFGSVVKAVTWIGNLQFKFKALNVEEAAAAIMAKNATSAYDSQTRSAAMLAQQIAGLTKQMQGYARANGMAMDSAGWINGAGGNRRRVNAVSGTNSYTYAAGSKDETGKPLAGHRASASDVAMFNAMRDNSKVIAENADTTRQRWDKIGRSVGSIAAIVPLFAVMAQDSAVINDTWINIAMVGGSLAMLFPGMFGKVATMVTGIGSGIGKWGKGTTSIKDTASRLVQAFRYNGVREVGRQVSLMAPRFASIAGSALRVFGPLGILAGGVFLVKKIADEMNRAEQAQAQLGQSGEAWANALGYDYQPGKVPGMEEGEVDGLSKRAQVVKELAESYEGLGQALIDAKNKNDEFETLYNQAMYIAARAAATGANEEQIKLAFQAALEMANIDEADIRELTIRFERVNLDNASAITAEFNRQLEGIFDGVKLRPQSIDNSDGTFTMWRARISEIFGGDLTEEMRENGRKAGNALGQGINASGGNQGSITMLLDRMSSETDSAFGGWFNKIRNGNSDIAKAFDDLGITGTESLMEALKNIDAAMANGDPLSGAQQALQRFRGKFASEIPQLQKAYEELMDVVLQGMVDEGTFTQEQIDDMREKLVTIGNLRAKWITGGQQFVGGFSKVFKLINDAPSMYGDPEPKSRGFAKMFDVLQNGAKRAGEGAKGAGRDFNTLNDALKQLQQQKADFALQHLKDTMEGTMDDIYQEADRRMQEHQDGILDGMRAAGEARQEAFDREEQRLQNRFDKREKAMERFFEHQEKAAERANEAQERASEKAWDRRIERLEKEADAVDNAFQRRIDGIQKQMDKEREADETRQRLFEREKTRLSRLAQSANASIDFNSALNSGNLDEAARISNESTSREADWAMEDEQSASEELSRKREKQMQAQIDRIEKERERRRASFEEEIEQTRKAKDVALQAMRERNAAEMDLLRKRRERAQEELRRERQVSQDSLAARRKADQKSTESAINRAQKDFDADRRGLAQRLRELQAFVPRNEREMRAHIKRIEAAYGAYGISLKGKGDQWSRFIADSLFRNTRTSAAKIRSEIGWTEIGKAISKRVEGGLGITSKDLSYFLKNGRFPGQKPANYAKEWKSIWSSVFPTSGKTKMSDGRSGGLHTGGMAIGGPTWTSKERTGIPRSASLYPSEVPMVLKRGEFVVNEKSTRKNLGLLQRINDSGGPVRDQLDPAMFRHNGGIAETAQFIPAAMSQIRNMSMESGVAKRITEYKLFGAMAARQAAMIAQQQAMDALSVPGGTGGGYIGGTGPIYMRMWAAIKRKFPRANRNSGMRAGDPGYHGKGMAIDLGEQGFAGGAGRPYLAAMNRWIYDNFRNSTELIYNGLGDDRPNLWHGKNYAYNAATQAQHRNHVHWAMTPEAIAAANRRGLMSGGGAGTAPTNVSGNRLIVKNLASSMYGWGGGQWDALYKLIMKESGFRNTAQNPTSTAYGMFQFLNSTWAGTGYSKTSDPRIQTLAGLKYIKSRYGSPSSALAFHLRNNWYDDGGWLMPGENQRVSNGTGKPEPVFTNAQFQIMKNAALAGVEYRNIRSGVSAVGKIDGSAGSEYNITIDLRNSNVTKETVTDIERAVKKVLAEQDSKRGRSRTIS